MRMICTTQELLRKLFWVSGQVWTPPDPMLKKLPRSPPSTQAFDRAKLTFVADSVCLMSQEVLRHWFGDMQMLTVSFAAPRLFLGAVSTSMSPSESST